MIDFKDTPFIVVDLDIAERNCRKIADSLRAHGIAWRPHIKTHKSVFLAKKQLEWGASAITCATLGEAQVMADAGIDDIYIAYPLIGEAKLARYLALHNRTKTLRTLVNSLDGAKALSDVFVAAGKQAEVLLEIDGRFGRGGITPAEILPFAQAVAAMTGLKVVGLASFCGAQSSIKDEAARRADARQEAEYLLSAAKLLNENGFAIDILSSGSSVSARYPNCLRGLTEARAGTCIFNDMTHLNLGTCTEADCAATIYSTVVTLIAPGQAIVDAGRKALTSDLSGAPGYGHIKGHVESMYIANLSEEHGFLTYPAEIPLKVGDIVQIIPNHICTAINLADTLICVQAETEPFQIKVDARGLNK